MKQLIKGIKNSVLFWNAIVILAVSSLIVITLPINGLTIYVLWMYSFLGIGAAIDNSLHDTSDTEIKHYWAFTTGFVLIIILGYLTFKSIRWLYKKSIIRFNNFLDGKKPSPEYMFYQPKEGVVYAIGTQILIKEGMNYGKPDQGVRIITGHADVDSRTIGYYLDNNNTTAHALTSIYKIAHLKTEK